MWQEDFAVVLVSAGNNRYAVAIIDFRLAALALKLAGNLSVNIQ